MEPNIRRSKSNTKKINRILGMTQLQITILSVLACFALTSIGLLAGMIWFDRNPLTNFQPVSPDSDPTNSSPISPTSSPNSQVSYCDSAEVNTWIDQTVPRLNAIDSDLAYLNTYPPNSLDDYVPYAVSAEQRYYAQSSQRTPTCLENLQEIALEELRLYWKGLEALVNGDGGTASDYFSRLVDLSYQVDQAIQEVEQNQ